MTIPDTISTAGSARQPSARAWSTSPSTSPSRRSATCSSPSPSAGSAASPTGRTRRSTSWPPTSARGSSASRAALDDVRRELDEYFAGTRRELRPRDRPLPLPVFHREVLRELARVPFGEVTTYGALAAKVGKPSAARAIGGAMNRNPIPIVLPCHRVIGSNGRLTGYAGGLDRKELLLRLEGPALGRRAGEANNVV